MNLKDELKKLMLLKDCELQTINLDPIIKEMLRQIGSTDPELRDHMIYIFFSRLIQGDFLKGDQLQYILEITMDNDHLFYRIEEINTDGVFTRSFSSLVMALVIEVDIKKTFLPQDLVMKAFNRTIEYFHKERDLRGYVEEKGWAHSVAHGADLMEALIKHPKINTRYYREALAAIEQFVLRDHGVYIDDEDERLVFPIEAMLKWETVEIVEWIHGLDSKVLKVKGETRYFHLKINTSHFLKSLYFRLKFNESKAFICPHIEGVLKNIHDDH
ncbi:DUF2785 domain-containing protein [Rossellomorea sp. BNER]|uniref:DUF2785 domain-containing protein n=1 Tax=Rossellomorea sp. BNER TaxID=2962031 RepID=UPI003AF235E7|nr:DUF2785 domain-containing protein [Rossellomorea sp. BNER]